MVDTYKISIICVEPLGEKLTEEHKKLGSHLTYAKLSEMEVDISPHGDTLYGKSEAKMNVDKLGIQYTQTFLSCDDHYYIFLGGSTHTLNQVKGNFQFDSLIEGAFKAAKMALGTNDYWDIAEQMSKVKDVNYFISAIHEPKDFFNNKMFTFYTGKCYFVKIMKTYKFVSTTVDEFVHDYNHFRLKEVYPGKIKKSTTIDGTYHLVQPLI